MLKRKAGWGSVRWAASNSATAVAKSPRSTAAKAFTLCASAALRGSSPALARRARSPTSSSTPGCYPVPGKAVYALDIEEIDGRYRLEEPIGQGGMGTVYRGRQLSVD